jgi:hypothetical protein
VVLKAVKICVSNNEVAILLNEKELWQEIEMFIPVCEEKSEKFEL